MAQMLSARGVKDYAGGEKIMRDWIVGTLVRVFESYGYNPLETPILERYETLTAKFAAGEGSDVSKEIFNLKDQGKRRIGLRFDLTVPLSRFVAQNPFLKMPFKRYEIGKTFRDGPIKSGRLREFWQCDVDLVGSNSMLADAEILLITLRAFEQLDIKAYIEINNRKLLFGILEEAGIKKEKQFKALTAIDKLKKFGSLEVKRELKKTGIKKEQVLRLMEIFDYKNLGQFETLKSKTVQEGARELQELFAYLKDKKEIIFNPSLARGLGYYTGTIFEGYISKEESSSVTSSICGGGRFDNMIGLFAKSKRSYPAVGISFGLEPITEYFKEKIAKKEMGGKRTVADVYVIPIGRIKEALGIAEQLRRNGINADMDVIGRGVSKNLEYASSQGIKYVIFIGENELKQGKVKLRDMISGREELLPLEEIKNRLRGS